MSDQEVKASAPIIMLESLAAHYSKFNSVLNSAAAAKLYAGDKMRDTFAGERAAWAAGAMSIGIMDAATGELCDVKNRVCEPFGLWTFKGAVDLPAAKLRDAQLFLYNHSDQAFKLEVALVSIGMLMQGKVVGDPLPVTLQPKSVLRLQRTAEGEGAGSTYQWRVRSAIPYPGWSHDAFIRLRANDAKDKEPDCDYGKGKWKWTEERMSMNGWKPDDKAWVVEDDYDFKTSHSAIEIVGGKK